MTKTERDWLYYVVYIGVDVVDLRVGDTPDRRK